MMQLLKILLFTFFVIFFEQALSAQKRNRLAVVETKNAGINFVISELYTTSIKDYNKPKAVIVLNIRSDSGKHEVRTALLNKDDFQWLLRGKRDELYGITEIHSVPVLVFGNNASDLFSVTAIRRKVKWVNTKRSVQRFLNYSEPPPIIFEPEVLVYVLKGDSIEIKYRGIYTIIR